MDQRKRSEKGEMRVEQRNKTKKREESDEEKEVNKLK